MHLRSALVPVKLERALYKWNGVSKYLSISECRPSTFFFLSNTRFLALGNT